jgi:enamine deaminase RidA (YjgF/YER057c/UK114 family)
MPDATADDRLRALANNPLEAGPPAFLPAVQTGSLLFTSGQVARDGEDMVARGVVGAGVTVEQGQACARQCAVNALLVAQRQLGSLARVNKVVKLTIFVASAPDFFEQPSVGNAASAVFRDVLGDAGSHARSAVGMASLPLGSPVELEAIFELVP